MDPKTKPVYLKDIEFNEILSIFFYSYYAL